MKKLLITIAMLWSVAFVTWGWTVPDQRLSYNVSFKWGMIDANMGVANVQHTISRAKTASSPTFP